MKAALIRRYGGSDQLALGEVEIPRPGSGQLLVKVRAASVNPVDWKIRKGELRLLLRASFPLVLGLDVAGEVVAVGPEVAHFEPGDAVCAMLDLRHGGGYAEYAAVNQAAAAAKPESLSFEEAAALPVAGLTALQGLRDQGGLSQGERVLINGGAGGVGHLAVQVAAVLGAAVSAVAGPRHQEFLRELGAVRALDYTRDDFTVEDAAYSVVFDVHGGRSYGECEPVLAEDGVYVTTRPGPAIALAALKARFNGMFGSRRRARWITARPSGEDLALLCRLAAEGGLRPIVDRVLPLADIALAHEASESGHTRGKLVIRIA